MIRGGHSKLGSQVLVCFSMYYHHFLPCILWLTGSTKTRNGTERNGTNGTVVFRRRDEGTTDFCLYVALHRRYSNVHVAAKVSTYSTEGMHCRTRLLPVVYSRKTGYLRTLTNRADTTFTVPCTHIVLHTRQTAKPTLVNHACLATPRQKAKS